MPIIAMSSAAFKFYLLGLIFICALSWSTGMPAKAKRGNCNLTHREKLIIYSKLLPLDETYADAEMDYGYDLCQHRHLLWT